MRSFVVTPSFCKAAMLEDFLQYIYSEPKNMEGFEHVVIDNHYPVDKEENHDRLKKLCDKYEIVYVNSGKDLGLHEGVNNAIRMVGIKPEDIYIGCDPDDRPTHGSFQAMREVMLKDPSLPVLALNFWVLPWKQKEHGLVMEDETIAGHRVWRHPGVEMWNVAAFNMRIIDDMGGFRQPNAYYGGIEIALYHHWVKLKMKMGYLRDFSAEAVPVDRKNPDLYDFDYGTWKIDHAQRGFKGSFEEWLKTKKDTA